MIDKGEQTGTRTLLVLLDWEKAFDKIKHHKLIEALQRMLVPPHIVKIIANLYRNAEFCVRIDGKASTWRQQLTGIRQGCPLSPYLFIIVMTVMYYDIHHDDQVRTTRQRVRGTEADEVLYADDTVCIGQTVAAMTRLLHAIEAKGLEYGLRLNKTKCEYLGIGGPGPVRFSDGTKLKSTDEVKYLGCRLNARGDPARELKKRFSDCYAILAKLHFFFRNSDNT
eukprot:12880533-Prorocentrum_lima.AAC.1